MDPREVAKLIDHTNLRQDATSRDIEKLCDEAKRYGFHSVCVPPRRAPYAHELLRGTNIKVCAVIGFPLGATFPEVKRFEADKVAQRVDELDVVINVSAAKSGDFNVIRKEFEDIAEIASSYNIEHIKAILDTCLLTRYEIAEAARHAIMGGATFLKTSTGVYCKASEEDVKYLRNLADRLGEEFGRKIYVKAAGGIRTRDDAIRMIEAGADRIGTSTGVRIIETAPK